MVVAPLGTAWNRAAIAATPPVAGGVMLETESLRHEASLELRFVTRAFHRIVQ